MDYGYHELGYKLFKPDKKTFLDYYLEEISGLAYYSEDTLAAIEDERGILYLISSDSGEIIRKIEFSNPGDYEGVEILGDKIYILKSDGDIFSFERGHSDEVEAARENTVLSSENNAEGLGASDGNLLVALKGSGNIDDNEVKGKAVYIYDPITKKLKTSEFLTIDKSDLNEFIGKRKYFNKINDFDPSAIARHPITEDYYILSADEVLVVFNTDLDLKEVIRLHPIIYNQVEGICFAPNGTMFISSEGGGGKGKLMQINYAK